jgi:hypothetical protein
MSVPLAVPVPLDLDAFAGWLDELADAGGVTAADLMALLQLAAAAHREWTELVHQLGPAGIASAAAQSAASSLDAILEQLRARLTDHVSQATS